MSTTSTKLVHQPRLFQLDISITLAVWPGLSAKYGVTGEFVGFLAPDGAMLRPVLAIERQALGTDVYFDLTDSQMQQAGVEVYDLCGFALTEHHA